MSAYDPDRTCGRLADRSTPSRQREEVSATPNAGMAQLARYCSCVMLRKQSCKPTVLMVPKPKLAKRFIVTDWLLVI